MAATTSVKYLHPLTKPSIPLPLLFLSEFLLILSYTVRPSPYRKLLFIPIAGLCLGLLFLTQYGIGDAVLEIAVGIRLLTVLCFASANILLSEPQKELRLLSGKGRDGKKKKKDDDDRGRGRRNGTADHAGSLTKFESDAPYENSDIDIDISSAPFLARLQWAFTLWFNPRGINFAHEPSAILPPRPVSQTTAQFVRETVLWIAVLYVVQDLAKVCLNFYDDMRRANDLAVLAGELGGAAKGHGGGNGGVLGVLGALGIDFSLWRLWSVSLPIMLYAMMHWTYGLLSVCMVLSGVSKPSDWPPLFGSPMEAYTLRRTWVRFWHQMFRRMFTLHASFLTSPLPKLNITGHIEVFLIFFISGLMHYAGEAYMMQDLLRSRAVLWFVLQAVGIAFEDGVVRIFRTVLGRSDLGSGTGTGKGTGQGIAIARAALRTLGYLWVFAWFGFTLPLWIDPLMRVGYAREARRSSCTWSPVRGVWKGEWWWSRTSI